MKAPKRSPWGTVDGCYEVAPGVLSVSTPSHGGLKLSRSRNAAMPESVRRKGGWYEEDCEWSLVALVHSDVLPDEREHAKSTAKNHYPDEYEALTGEKVDPSESYVLRRRAHEAATYDKFVTRSAFGDWAKDVPAGMVKVCATKRSTGEERSFLVTAAEYASRTGLGFVVDESRHAAC